MIQPTPGHDGAGKLPTLDPAPTPDRRARRRQETRTRLLRAARGLFAQQGVDRTAISEITERADVGIGSFYNHFESKEAIVEAVLAETVAAQGAALEAATRHLEDPAEVMAVAHQHFVDLARTDPDWAWLLVRLDLSHDIMLVALAPYARRDLARGIESGRFQVADADIALYGIGGALLAVMRAVLDGRAPADAARLHSEAILRILGLPAEEAADVARRSAPPST